jgi:hypothetical protein
MNLDRAASGRSREMMEIKGCALEESNLSDIPDKLRAWG